MSQTEALADGPEISLSWHNLSGPLKDLYLQNHFYETEWHRNHVLDVTSTIINIVIMALGIPSNIMTLFIIIFKSGNTPTNLFLLNLTIVDTFSLIFCSIVEIINIWWPKDWPFGLWGCRLMTVASESVSYISVLTMMAFTFERFTAICYPLRPSLHSGMKRTRVIIISIWTISLLIGLAWTKYINLHVAVFGDNQNYIESNVCGMSQGDIGSGALTLTIANVALFYIFPAILLPVAYIKIYKAMKAAPVLQAVTHGSEQQQKNRIVVYRTQVALAICFFICWTPYNVQKLVFILTSMSEAWTSQLASFYQYSHRISGILYFSNCMMNPFLYSLCSRKFRQEMKDVLNALINIFRRRNNGVEAVESPNSPMTRKQEVTSTQNGMEMKEIKRQNSSPRSEEEGLVETAV